MQINVNIQIPPGEHASDLAGNSEELADAFLKAAGGDEDKDFCSVYISDAGNVGVPSSTPPAMT
jgi:hypothetical protein